MDMLDLYLNDYPIRKITKLDEFNDKETYNHPWKNQTVYDIFQIQLPNKCCIAGGSIVDYLLGKNKSADYDIFMWDDFYNNINEILKIFTSINSYVRSKNYIEIIGLISDTSCYSDEYIKVQIILSKYNSLEQILKSFDLWASQVAYYKGNFYGTEQAIWAIKNKKQPFDYRKANTSYIPRILKYSQKKDIKCFTINGRRNSDLIKKIYYDKNSEFWLIDSTNSMYCEQKHYMIDDYYIRKRNIEYLLGLTETYYVTKEGEPLYIGTLINLFTFYGGKKLQKFLNGIKVQVLSDLGSNIPEIIDKFQYLEKINRVIPLELKEKVRQFRGVNFNEAVLYSEYTPIWIDPKLYPKTSWNYRYTIFLLFEMGWLPQDIRNIIILKWSCMNIQEIELELEF